jgi:phage terminase large subunit-like protein
MIPVLFPDSREFSSGDRFDGDCVRHHAFLLVPKVSSPVQRPANCGLFGMRTGKNPQVCITTTPRPIALLKEIMSDPATVVTSGATFDNRAETFE